MRRVPTIFVCRSSFFLCAAVPLLPACLPAPPWVFLRCNGFVLLFYNHCHNSPIVDIRLGQYLAQNLAVATSRITKLRLSLYVCLCVYYFRHSFERRAINNVDRRARWFLAVTTGVTHSLTHPLIGAFFLYGGGSTSGEGGQ